MKLKGKVAIITGAGAGIGEAAPEPGAVRHRRRVSGSPRRSL